MMQCIRSDYGILSLCQKSFLPQKWQFMIKNTHSKAKSTARTNNCTRIFVQFELFPALDYMMIYSSGRKSARKDVHKMTKFSKFLQTFTKHTKK